MNYLSLWLKTWYKPGIRAPRNFPPHDESFLPAVSCLKKVNGFTLAQFLQFSTKPLRSPSFAFTRWNLIKLFIVFFCWIVKILDPVSIRSFTYGPYKKLCKSNHQKTYTRILKFLLIKEVVWILTWRPQSAILRIGASNPPLSSCKKLERSFKSNSAGISMIFSL
jgi:hypothetical protein